MILAKAEINFLLQAGSQREQAYQSHIQEVPTGHLQDYRTLRKSPRLAAEQYIRALIFRLYLQVIQYAQELAKVKSQ